MPTAPQSQKPTGERPLYRRTFLQEWREAAGLTQEQLAREVGVTKGHISKVELGTRQYTQEILEAAVSCLRLKFPGLTVGALIALDPRAPSVANIVDLAGRVPEHLRPYAASMLHGLAAHGVTEPGTPSREGKKP